jgi:hypothetical protein
MSSQKSVVSFIGVPLAPFSPSAKIEGREEWGENREGGKKRSAEEVLMAELYLRGLLSGYHSHLRTSGPSWLVDRQADSV